MLRLTDRELDAHARQAALAGAVASDELAAGGLDADGEEGPVVLVGGLGGPGDGVGGMEEGAKGERGLVVGAVADGVEERHPGRIAGRAPGFVPGVHSADYDWHAVGLAAAHGG